MTFVNKLKIVGQLLWHKNNKTLQFVLFLENNPLCLHNAPYHTTPSLIIFLQQHTLSCFSPSIPLLIYSYSMSRSSYFMCLQG